MPLLLFSLLAMFTVPQSLLPLPLLPLPRLPDVFRFDFSLKIFAMMSGSRSICSGFTDGGLACTKANKEKRAKPAADLTRDFMTRLHI
jgi:hypothetical protein